MSAPLSKLAVQTYTLDTDKHNKHEDNTNTRIYRRIFEQKHADQAEI